MITVNHKGDFNKTERFFKGVFTTNYMTILEKYGNRGLSALIQATPKDSGLTAQSWSYKIERYRCGATITWSNSNLEDGVPIVVLLQYGHATKNGGFVNGKDFINPALRTIFNNLTEDLWREVTAL